MLLTRNLTKFEIRRHCALKVCKIRLFKPINAQGEAMLVKTILNAVEKFKAFVYGKTYWQVLPNEKSLVISSLHVRIARVSVIRNGYPTIFSTTKSIFSREK